MIGWQWKWLYSDFFFRKFVTISTIKNEQPQGVFGNNLWIFCWGGKSFLLSICTSFYNVFFIFIPVYCSRQPKSCTAAIIEQSGGSSDPFGKFSI